MRRPERTNCHRAKFAIVFSGVNTYFHGVFSSRKQFCYTFSSSVKAVHSDRRTLLPRAQMLSAQSCWETFVLISVLEERQLISILFRIFPSSVGICKSATNHERKCTKATPDEKTTAHTNHGAAAKPQPSWQSRYYTSQDDGKLIIEVRRYGPGLLRESRRMLAGSQTLVHLNVSFFFFSSL